MANTDRDWSLLGAKDPYYGVLADERFRSDAIEQNRDGFMQSGEDYVRSQLADLERALGSFSRRRALDFGCGVGRLTLPLALRFNEVIGLDVAPAMLAEAEINRQRTGVLNAEFRLSDDSLSQASGEFDFVHTYIVLQHIPVGRGMHIIRELIRRVAAGGVISLHFSLGRRESVLQSFAYGLRRYIPGAQRMANYLRQRPSWEPLMQMNQYSIEDVLALMSESGFGKALVSLERHGKFLTAQVIAQRERSGG